MTPSRAWVLPLAPVAAVLLVALAFAPFSPGPSAAEGPLLLGFLVLAVGLAAGVAAAARHIVGRLPEPAGHRLAITITTGVVTLLAPFAVGLLLDGPTSPLLAFPWLMFGLVAAGWQLYLCEGPRSRVLHAAIGFGYTFSFAGLTLAASGLVN
jgi:hypothetical protein